jgi:hypothetical protein
VIWSDEFELNRVSWGSEDGVWEELQTLHSDLNCLLGGEDQRDEGQRDEEAECEFDGHCDFRGRKIAVYGG